MGLPDTVKTVLITNGSLLYRNEVRQGLRDMVKINGEVWFKLDRASAAGMLRVNDIRISMNKVRGNLEAAIACCPTWLQTCWFALDGEPPSRQDEDDYLEFVAALLRDGHQPQGVLLYSLARRIGRHVETREYFVGYERGFGGYDTAQPSCSGCSCQGV